ncbi:hypothetical protein ABIA35_006012 [Catenulispora sp. MAP12-49]|uniref:hypothetical protein n=1 Tax=Catenulispora sp. MAP12-49 TaxID=3156302 RepID=UPI003517799B
MSDFMDTAAAALERLAVADATVEAEYGRCVAPDRFERYEDGQLVSTLVYDAPDGRTVAYQVIGVSWADLC